MPCSNTCSLPGIAFRVLRRQHPFIENSGSPKFEAVGHCFWITLSLSLKMLYIEERQDND